MVGNKSWLCTSLTISFNCSTNHFHQDNSQESEEQNSSARQLFSFPSERVSWHFNTLYGKQRSAGGQSPLNGSLLKDPALYDPLEQDAIPQTTYPEPASTLAAPRPNAAFIRHTLTYSNTSVGYLHLFNQKIILILMSSLLHLMLYSHLYKVA